MKTKTTNMKLQKISRILVLMAALLTVSVSCNGQQKSSNDKDKATPENVLCQLNENEDGSTYLTYEVRLLSEDKYENMPFMGNGDYFLYYHTEYISANPKRDIRIRESYTLHVIPEDNGRFRLETRMDSSTFYENEENVGHAEPSGEWNFVGYSDDEHCATAKVLNYFLSVNR